MRAVGSAGARPRPRDVDCGLGSRSFGTLASAVDRRGSTGGFLTSFSVGEQLQRRWREEGGFVRAQRPVDTRLWDRGLL